MAAKSASKAINDDLVTVIVSKPIDIIGDTETVVGVNGTMYQIQYDKPVTVPRNVAEVIENSKALQVKIEEFKEQSVMTPGKGAMAEL